MKKVISLLILSIFLLSCGREKNMEVIDGEVINIESDITTDEVIDELINEALTEDEINSTLEDFFKNLEN